MVKRIGTALAGGLIAGAIVGTGGVGAVSVFVAGVGFLGAFVDVRTVNTVSEKAWVASAAKASWKV